jgi:hypothetical protein
MALSKRVQVFPQKQDPLAYPNPYPLIQRIFKNPQNLIPMLTEELEYIVEYLAIVQLDGLVLLRVQACRL